MLINVLIIQAGHLRKFANTPSRKEGKSLHLLNVSIERLLTLKHPQTFMLCSTHEIKQKNLKMQTFLSLFQIGEISNLSCVHQPSPHFHWRGGRTVHNIIYKALLRLLTLPGVCKWSSTLRYWAGSLFSFGNLEGSRCLSLRWIVWDIGICLVPHVHQSTAHSLFNVGTRRRTVAHTRPVVLKMPRASTAFL